MLLIWTPAKVDFHYTTIFPIHGLTRPCVDRGVGGEGLGVGMWGGVGWGGEGGSGGELDRGGGEGGGATRGGRRMMNTREDDAY